MLKQFPKGLLVGAIFFHILSAAIGPSSVFVTSLFIDSISSYESIGKYLPIYAGLSGASIIFNFFAIYFTTTLAIHTGKNLRKRLLRHILSLEPLEFERRSVGEYAARFSSDIQAITNGLKAFIPLFIGSSFTFIWFSVFTFILQPSFGYIILGLGLTLAVVSYLPLKKTLEKTIQAQQSIAVSGGFITESLNGFKTIYSFQQQDTFVLKFNNFVENIIKAEKQALSIYAGSSAANNLLVSGSLVIAAYVCYEEVQAGNVTIGKVAALWATLSGAALSVRQSVFAINEVTKIKASLASLEKIFRLHSTNVGGHITAWKQNLVSLEFQDVTFAYGPQVVFNNLSFKIKEGSITSIVGPSGVGKSTIISLILGFLTPTQGEILLDNESKYNYDSVWLKSQIGYVPQDVSIFSETIEFNIRLGNNSVEQHRVMEVADLVGMHDTIMEFPEGYKTLVGSNGVALSGGQKQRIAIARALLGKPKVLILDEATSALDSTNEEKVAYTLAKLKKLGTTVLIIAHRMKTVALSDNIFVLLNGAIVEQGSFEQLMAAGGVFTTMVKVQETERATRDRSATL